jgi:hypothetical protein
MARTFFNRYIWLIDTIRRAKYITFKELSEKWQRSSLNERGEPLPERTFFNHCKEILDQFGIEIKYVKPKGYCIANEDELGEDGLRNWMLNSISVNNTVRESADMRSRILFEDIPSGYRFLNDIIEAMKEGKKLRIEYTDYEKDSSSSIIISPYCVKLFHQRWYVLGKLDAYRQPRLFCLDRIDELEILDSSFRLPKSFDARQFFDEHYGVVIDDEIPPQRIRLKVSPKQWKYFQSLPLHQSQRELESNDQWTILEYHMAPTWDLAMELMKYYDKVEVLEPESLRNEVIDYAYCILEQYGERP